MMMSNRRDQGPRREIRKAPLMSFVVVALFFLTMLANSGTTLGFTSLPATPAFRNPGCNTYGGNRKQLFTADNPFATPEKAKGISSDVKDSNGKQFQVGEVVRVVKGNLKAYQVPPKGHGTFGDDKKFIPASPDSTRSGKNLVLPVGLRGKVTKIYDNDDISANLPVQVKFSPGEDVDEGYDPPVAFLMHFQPNEVECA